ncbi:hypothetical protein AAFF_G00321820 [Aldrovandia affinis]|uniref:Uncharacterized protein n=1 Tax=Aldrovandia affinis TaxID=143900 RepID=A0AAD7WQ07_9TELE|nr:hypothetical protein AAFF_G00321820 [Aldrovandia affinis]
MAVAPEPSIKGDSPVKRGDREGSERPESPKDRGRGQQRHKRQQRASDQSNELDIKPVRLSSVHDDSSESSSICSETPRGGTAGERSWKRERKGGIRQNGMDREEGTSQK